MTGRAGGQRKSNGIGDGPYGITMLNGGPQRRSGALLDASG
jgi:hypothetical protein